MLWYEINRATLAKLVKVVRASSGGDWMDVRFGNPDYARLVGELNRSAERYAIVKSDQYG